MPSIPTLFASTLLWIVLSFTAIPFFALLTTYRILLSKIVSAVDSKVDQLLSPFDEYLLFDDPKKEITLFIAVGVEGKVSLEDVRTEFQTKIIQKRDSQNRLTRPQLQQYVATICRHHFWKWEDHFNIDNHIRLLEVSEAWDKKQKSAKEILDLLKIEPSYKTFAKSMSPWELMLVPNFHDTPIYGCESSDGYSGTLLILRINHVLGDGASFRELFEELFEKNRKIYESDVVHTTPRQFSKTQLFETYFFGPWNFRRLVGLHMNSPNKSVTEFQKAKHNLSKFNICITPRIDIKQIKQIQQFQEVSFSAVVLGLVAKAYRRYLFTAGLALSENICWSLPRAVPHKPRPVGALKNHISTLFVPLGVDDEGQFKRVEALLQNEIKSSNLAVYYELMYLTALLPNFLKRKVFVSLAGLVTLTNIPLIEGGMAFQGVNRVRTAFVMGLSETVSPGMTCLSIGCNKSIRLVFEIAETIIPIDHFADHAFANSFMEELSIWVNKTKV